MSLKDVNTTRDGMPLDEYISHFYFGLYYQIYHPLNVLTCASGLVTNLLNVVILTRPAMKENTMNFLLTTLAISDIIFVMARVCWSVPYYLSKTRTDFINLTTEMYDNGVLIIESSCILSSEWLNVTIGVWRLIAVMWPLRAKYLCSQKRARNVAISVAVSSVLFNLPDRLLTQQGSYDLNGIPVSIVIVRKYNDNSFPLRFYFAVGVILLLLPILTSIFVTICLIRKMYTLRQSPYISVVSFKQAVAGINRTTGMLTIMLVIFICTYASTSILYVSYYVTILNVASNRNIYLFLQSLDKSTTFFIYFSMSRKFRKTCRDIFSTKK